MAVYDERKIDDIRRISSIVKQMRIRCPNCKAIMTQEEYYDGHLNNEECLTGQKELEEEWQRKHKIVVSKWKRKT